MFSIFILLFHYVRKSFQSIFLGFFLPLILLVILVPIIKSFNADAERVVLPGLIMSVGPILGIVSLAMTYADFRHSIIIKRIGATPLKPYTFIGSLFIFYVFLIIVGSMWVLGIGSLFYMHSIDFSIINWNFLLLAMLLSALMSCSFGLIIGIKAKDSQMANALGYLIYIPTSFLSGQYIPFAAFRNQQILIEISKGIPFSYPISIISRAWNHYGDPKFLQQFVLFDNYWLPIVVSIAWICGGLIISALLYKYRNK